MKAIFLNNILRIFLLPPVFIFLLTISFLYANAQTSSYLEQKKGSINVCVLIIDASGKILNNSKLANLPFFSFELPILRGESYLSAGVFERAYFNKPYFNLNTNIFSDRAKNDAVCISFDNLTLGSYFYQKEIINQQNEWFEPFYNDQYLGGSKSLKDLFLQTEEFFTLTDDANKNFNKGRQIILTKDRPDRTVLVFNQYKNGQEAPAKCSAGLNNANEGFGCSFLDVKNNKSKDYSKKDLEEKKLKKGVKCNYLSEYLRINKDNNPSEVKKLQVFLRDYEGFSELGVTGVFDENTFKAVSKFQLKYKDDILTPWGASLPSGYVYITTSKKINEIYCQSEIFLTEKQQEEIDRFKENKLIKIQKRVEIEEKTTSKDLNKEIIEDQDENKGKSKVIGGDFFKKNNEGDFSKQNVNDVVGLNSKNASSTKLMGILAGEEKKQISKVEGLGNFSLNLEKELKTKISAKEAITVTSVVLGGKFVSSGLFWVFLVFFSTLVFFYFRYRKSVENNENINKGKNLGK